MLMSIGPFVFDLIQNVEAYDGESNEDFARKDVVGARKPYEHVGPGDDKLTMIGRLFPGRLGGEGAVEALRGLQRAAAPQLVVRGDGKLLGWYLILRVRDRNEYLNGRGVPGHVELDIDLEACDQPSGAGSLGALLSL